MDSLHFLDGQFIGSADDHSHDGAYPDNRNLAINSTAKVAPGPHNLLLLSDSFGYMSNINNGTLPRKKGIFGNVTLNSVDITTSVWNMRPNLVGQVLDVYTPEGSDRVTWSSDLGQAGPVTWYSTTFNLPAIPQDTVLLLNASGLGRGHVFINGFDIGRYWLLPMSDRSGRPSQLLYYIPPDVVVQGANVMTLIEILGVTNLNQVSIIQRKLVPSEPQQYLWSDHPYKNYMSCPMMS